jgi:hypothetical protein
MTKLIETEVASREASVPQSDVVPREDLKPRAAWRSLGYEKIAVVDAQAGTAPPNPNYDGTSYS